MLSRGAPLAARPLELVDFPLYQALVLANAKRFKDAGLAQLPETVDRFERWLAPVSTVSAPAALRTVYGVWRQAGKKECLIGFVGTETVHRFKGTGLWYGLDVGFQGQGLAKTAVLLSMADFSGRTSSVDMSVSPRWVLHVHRRNMRSARLANSLGFARDEMLDYTRTSGRGGIKFEGYLLSRATHHMSMEACARLTELAMTDALSASKAILDVGPSVSQAARRTAGV